MQYKGKVLDASLRAPSRLEFEFPVGMAYTYAALGLSRGSAVGFENLPAVPGCGVAALQPETCVVLAYTHARQL